MLSCIPLVLFPLLSTHHHVVLPASTSRPLLPFTSPLSFSNRKPPTQPFPILELPNLAPIFPYLLNDCRMLLPSPCLNKNRGLLEYGFSYNSSEWKLPWPMYTRERRLDMHFLGFPWAFPNEFTPPKYDRNTLLLWLLYCQTILTSSLSSGVISNVYLFVCFNF